MEKNTFLDMMVFLASTIFCVNLVEIYRKKKSLNKLKTLWCRGYFFSWGYNEDT